MSKSAKILHVLPDNVNDIDAVENTTNPNALVDELNDTQRLFNQHMKTLEIRQSALLNHIHDIEQANEQINSTIYNKQLDAKARNKLYQVITRNVELLARLYDVYKELESVKERYLRDRSEVSLKYHRLIHIDIPMLNNKLDNVTNDSLVAMLKALNEIKPQINENETVDLAINDDKYEI